jgi:hypothetical protein
MVNRLKGHHREERLWNDHDRCRNEMEYGKVADIDKLVFMET